MNENVKTEIITHDTPSNPASSEKWNVVTPPSPLNFIISQEVANNSISPYPVNRMQLFKHILTLLFILGQLQRDIFNLMKNGYFNIGVQI